MSTIDLILEKLKERHMSGVEFCNTLGLSRQSLQYWQTGMSHTYMKILPEISRYLGVSTDELLAAAAEHEKKYYAPGSRAKADIPASALDLIIRRMKAKKLTATALCQALGVSSRAFNNWKTGRSHLYMKMLPEIADQLGIPLDELQDAATDEERKHGMTTMQPSEDDDSSEKAKQKEVHESTIEVIRKNLEEMNLSGAMFCGDMNLPRHAFENWKRGASHSYMKMLPEIAEYLGISVEELENAATEDEKKHAPYAVKGSSEGEKKARKNKSSKTKKTVKKTGTPKKSRARDETKRETVNERKAENGKSETTSVLSLILQKLKEKQISSRAFCRSLNIPTHTVSNWKTGKSHSYMKMLPEIEAYLNVKNLQAAATEQELKVISKPGEGETGKSEKKPVKAEGKKTKPVTTKEKKAKSATAETKRPATTEKGKNAFLSEMNRLFTELPTEVQIVLLKAAKQMAEAGNRKQTAQERTE